MNEINTVLLCKTQKQDFTKNQIPCYLCSFSCSMFLFIIILVKRASRDNWT